MEPPKTAPELPDAQPVREPQLVRLSRSPEPPIPASDPDEPDELNEHVFDPGDPDGVVERETYESVARPEPTAAPVVKVRKHHPFLKALLILVVIAGLAVGVYHFASQAANRKDNPTKPKAATTQTSNTSAVVTTTKTYSSDAFALSFDYPTNWKVTETAASITAISPVASLLTTGGNTTGVAVFTIQNQQTTIPNYPAGGGTAALASDKLTYANPSGVQRAQTYLSYVGYSDANSINGLFITGDNGYLQSQTIPMSDVIKGNPLVSVQFMSCPASGCVGAPVQSIALKSSSWTTLPLQSQITKMLESIVFN